MSTSGPSNNLHRSDGLPPITPDSFEQDHPEQIDNVVPTHGYQTLPMVGLGGSAGAIPALAEFFQAMPADSGMVFVVIMHLSPDHESTLAAVIGRATTMPVVQAGDIEEIRPNHVYVIPPGKLLTAVDGGHLRLADMHSERGKRVAVDMFFRSLADTHGPHAMAVVLSGMDGDGALGIKRVKERGGLTIAQDPSEAEHPGMPRSAMDTGMVDWVLKVSEIPGRLTKYLQHEGRLKLPPEDGPPLPSLRPPVSGDAEAALLEILVFLRARTGRDFSCYKRATVLRRIARRMQVNAVETLPEYVTYLRTHAGEAGALLQDLLISVTNFFRDRESFDALGTAIPDMFADKTMADSVRAWIPACATGEEAYSIAMMLVEHADTLPSSPSIQVFACDLNEEAIQIARAGQYPDTIVADVSEERLRRFFIKDHAGYRVRRELREMVLFAPHDLLKDAPFSRMDLISCRNLLIYLNRAAQQRVFDIFHFAMRPGGCLFLGSSESVEDGSPLFRVLDKKNRLYVHQPLVRSSIPLPIGPGTLGRDLRIHEQSHAPPVVHGRRFVQDSAAAFHPKLGPELGQVALGELHLALVEKYAPPSVLISAEHDIVHLSEHAGAFLQFTSGEPTMSLMRMVHPELRVDLRAALFRVAESKGPVQITGVKVDIDGKFREIDIRVAPAGDIAPGFLLVTFDARDAADTQPPPATDDSRSSSESVVHHLERELKQVKLHLRETVEQYEASTEELKASNEELQAMNEELRSATEELETSREELQSINEELSTVNQELKGKVDELAGANSDLQNLMASTSIATVFLDRQLRITRFTPNAAGIFHMIPGDIGRPLEHLKHEMDYPNLIADAADVLRTLIPVEREVSGGERRYLARLQPFRTVEDQIAGIVVTLVDVTDRNLAVEALRRSEERLRILIESAKDYAIFSTDTTRLVNTWNTGAEGMFGYAEAEIVGRSGDILFTPEDQARGAPQRESSLAAGEGVASNERWHARKDGTIFYGSGTVRPLRDSTGKLSGFVKIMRDLTERKRDEEALQRHLEELSRFNGVAVGRESRMIHLKQEINALCVRLGEAPRYRPDLDGPQEEQR